MTTQSTKCNMKPKPGVVHTEMEAGTAVLLDMETHRYFSLNESGAFIWNKLSTGTPVADVASLVAERYSLDHAKAQRDVDNLISELSKAGLLLKDA